MPYPRICGANGGTRLRACSQFPLPPRTWGKRSSLLDATRQDASTPTHVGQTFITTAFWGITALYPHARGANWRFSSCSSAISPLPPRTWGKPGKTRLLVARRASTPTHVRQTIAVIRLSPSASLYPHARGANPHRCRNGRLGEPLPPRTWGKPWGARRREGR